MSIDISSLAFAVRTASAQSPHPLTLSQAQQCVAAALSFKTLASFQASGEGRLSLDSDTHVVLDVACLVHRARGVGAPHDEAVLVALIGEAFRKKLPGVHVHISWAKFEDALRELIDQGVLNDPNASGAMASTNTFGINEIYLPFDIDWEAIPSNGDPLEIPIEGHVSLEIDDERPYSGHRINVKARLWVCRLGQAIYGVPWRMDSATLDWDSERDDPDDEPPKISLTQALAEELGLSFDEADELVDAEVQPIEGHEGMVYAFVFDFSTVDAPKAVQSKIQKKHGSLSVRVSAQFFERVHGHDPNPDRYYVHGDQIEGAADQYYCSHCDALVAAPHFESDHPDTSGERYFATLQRWQKRPIMSKVNERRPINAMNVVAAAAEAGRAAREASRSEFHLWLERQAKRKDLVGDLARDVRGDREFPISEGTRDGIQTYLTYAGASTPAVKAFKQAWTEFSG
nr:YozE family protein [uncultured Albidiferax sp.]